MDRQTHEVKQIGWLGKKTHEAPKVKQGMSIFENVWLLPLYLGGKIMRFSIHESYTQDTGRVPINQQLNTLLIVKKRESFNSDFYFLIRVNTIKWTFLVLPLGAAHTLNIWSIFRLF